MDLIQSFSGSSFWGSGGVQFQGFEGWDSGPGGEDVHRSVRSVCRSLAWLVILGFRGVSGASGAVARILEDLRSGCGSLVCTNICTATSVKADVYRHVAARARSFYSLQKSLISL